MKLSLIDSKASLECDRIWLNDFKKNKCCLKCKTMLPEFQKASQDVYLDESPSMAAISSLPHVNIEIARVDFLELFEDEVKSYLNFGKVYYRNKCLDKFVSITGYPRMLLHGQAEGSTFNGKCQFCGRLLYWPNPPWYVLRPDLKSRRICLSYPCDGLVLSEELVSRIEPGRWKGIYMIPLEVRDEPLDGFDIPLAPLLV